MKIIHVCIILVGALIINACGDTQKKKVENPFAGQVDALKKAKDVERLLQEATEKRLKNIDAIN